MNNVEQYRGWEYAQNGDYHRNLDPNWSYAPTYIRKVTLVREFVNHLDPSLQILDVGCGEGVLVEEFAAAGRPIEGLDLNYESRWVRRGDILAMPYPDGQFDAVLFLDVFEHLAYANQPRALHEIRRVLTTEGVLIMTVPNLAHLNSRIRMLLRGQLDRTDIETNHIGERPIAENLKIVTANGFRITDVKGVTLTLPWLYRSVICRRPARYRWLHDFLERFAVPELAMLTFLVCVRD